MTSSVQLYTQSISEFQNLETQLDADQAEIGATSKATTFAGLGSDLTSIEGFQLSSNKATMYINAIADANQKNNVLYQSIQNIISVANSFKSTLTLANSTTGSSVSGLSAAANSALQSIGDSLNAQYNDDYVFGGSKTNVQPVNDLTSSDNIENGSTPTANYYNGDSVKASVDVSSTSIVQYGIIASDPTFQKLIGAINLAQTQSTNGTTADYTQAGNMLDDAINGLVSLQAQTGESQTALDNNSQLQTAAQTTFNQNFSTADSPDIVQLTVETSQLQATLEASFSLFSKIQDLTLTKYL